MYIKIFWLEINFYFYRLLKEFKEANISSMFAIEKAQRENLLKSPNGEESIIRNRKKKADRDSLLKMSTGQ